MSDIEHFACADAVHIMTGDTITKYRTSTKDPATRDIWIRAFGKELDRLAQDDSTTDINCDPRPSRHLFYP